MKEKRMFQAWYNRVKLYQAKKRPITNNVSYIAQKLILFFVDYNRIQEKINMIIFCYTEMNCVK